MTSASYCNKESGEVAEDVKRAVDKHSRALQGFNTGPPTKSSPTPPMQVKVWPRRLVTNTFDYRFGAEPNVSGQAS